MFQSWSLSKYAWGDQTVESFQAKIAQLMFLIISTFYLNEGIILEQFISKWSDTWDKIKCESLKYFSKLYSGKELHINLISNAHDWTFTIVD
jgi:HSP90 family molecular chaperone